MREREIEKHLVDRLDAIQIRCMKFVPDQLPGMPDRLVLLPDGRVLWVELKTTGGRLSELQKFRHAELRDAGHDVVVVWSKGQVDELVQDIMKRTGLQEPG